MARFHLKKHLLLMPVTQFSSQSSYSVPRHFILQHSKLVPIYVSV